MPDHPDTGVFVEKRSYRRRRLIDGLKLLPFLGAWLFLLPAFWPSAEAEASHTMSTALYYVFGVWLALIVACAALVFKVNRSGARGEDGGPERDADDPGNGESRQP